MAQNPTFSDIIWKQFHLSLLILVFAFNLNIEKKAEIIIVQKYQGKGLS